MFAQWEKVNNNSSISFKRRGYKTTLYKIICKDCTASGGAKTLHNILYKIICKDCTAKSSGA